MAVAARAESPIDKGMAGPGLLAYIVTSKFRRVPSAVSLGSRFCSAGF